MLGDLIKFYKNSIVTNIYDPDGKNAKEVDIRLLDYDLSYYFNNIVEFDDGLTVEDFLNQLSKYEKLIDLTFESYTNSIPLCLYMREIYTIPDEKNIIKNLDYIELFEEINIYEDYLENYLSFRGIKDKKIDNDTVLNLIPLRYWKHLKFKINNITTMYKNTLDKKGKIQKYDLIYTGQKDFTLFEVLSNFLLELTSYGEPAEISAVYNELKSEELKNYIESEEIQNEINLIKNDFLNEELEDAIKKEDYEKAKKLKEEIENNKKNE
jgi:hypothetical protein